MNDATLNLATVVGWPFAPSLMLMIALGWEALVGYLRRNDVFGGPSGRRRHRRSVSERRWLREQFGRPSAKT